MVNMCSCDSDVQCVDQRDVTECLCPARPDLDNSSSSTRPVISGTTKVVRYKSNRRIAEGVIAVVLALLLAGSLACRPALAAPPAPTPRLTTPRPASPRPSLPRHAPSRSPRNAAPWSNPCGSPISVPHGPITPSHARPKHKNAVTTLPGMASPPPGGGNGTPDTKGWSLRNVRGKIRIARAHLRHRRWHINQVYRGVKPLSNQYSFDWLPHQQVQWYRSEIKCLDRDSQAAQVLPALHAALQNFSATFLELQKTRRWSIDQPGIDNRRLIISEIASNVKGMLCEVETAMQERSLLAQMSLKQSDVSLDVANTLTGALIQDWGVVSAYMEALRGWALILRELGHAPKRRPGEPPAVNNNAPCPTNSADPLVLRGTRTKPARRGRPRLRPRPRPGENQLRPIRNRRGPNKQRNDEQDKRRRQRRRRRRRKNRRRHERWKNRMKMRMEEMHSTNNGFSPSSSSHFSKL